MLLYGHIDRKDYLGRGAWTATSTFTQLLSPEGETDILCIRGGKPRCLVGRVSVYNHRLHGNEVYEAIGW